MTWLLSLAVVTSGPLDEIDAARAAYARLPDDRKASTIFVSFLGSPDIDETRINCELAINHATRRRKTIRVNKVLGSQRESLYYIDAEDLGWKLAGVKRMLEREPYFYPIAPDVYMVRGDWLLRDVTFGKTYYDLLFDNPKTLTDIFKVLGFDAKSNAVAIVQHGARVVDSRVSSIGYRVAACLGSSPSGPIFITDDLNNPKTTRPKEFIREKIDALRFQNPDAHEVFGHLPNGLYWYALSNAKDELQEQAPDGVAVDTRDYKHFDKLKDIVNERPNRNNTVIENPHKCMTCHALGTQPAPDWVADAMAGNKLDVTGYDPKTRDKLEDFYHKQAENDTMAYSSKLYTDSISRVTLKPAAESMRSFAIDRWKWNEELVTRKQAAAELNVDEKEFERLAGEMKASSTEDRGFSLRMGVSYWLLEHGRKGAARAVLGYDDKEFADFLAGKIVLPLGSNSLNTLGKDKTLSRLEWEGQIFTEAALVFCYEKRAKEAVTAEMVRKKFNEEGKPDLPPAKDGIPPPVKNEPPLGPKTIPPEVYNQAAIGQRLPWTDPNTRESYMIEKAADGKWYRVQGR